MSYCFLTQNGLAERAMRYGPGNSSPQLAVGSPLDSHGGSVGSGNPEPGSKRPKNLQVTSANGFATKNLREDVDDSGGSQPCTPEPASDAEPDASGCAAGDEVLDSDTRELISQCMAHFTGRSRPQWKKERKELSTMKRVVNGVLEKHRYAFNGMINRLSLDDRGDDVRFVSAVAESLFSDGTMNWGRVASLVAFGAVVCQHLKEGGRENCVEPVGQEISTYLLSHQREWLVKNNAWNGFVEFFRVPDPESTMRNALIGIAGVAGIGATLALLIR